MNAYEEQKAITFDEYDQINAIKDNEGNIVKARLVYCSKAAKYVIKKGPTLNKLCPGCIIIKQNYSNEN